MVNWNPSTTTTWHSDTQPAPAHPVDPAFDVAVPDICLQLQDTRPEHTPCLGGEDRAKIEAAIKTAIESDFPGAYVTSTCAGAGEPAGEAAAFGIWTAPPDQLTPEQQEAMRAAAAQPIERAPGETIAFFLSKGLFERLAQLGWDKLPKRIDDKGIAQLDGPIHLSALRVFLQPPDTVVTEIDGTDERPVPDVPFTIRIDEPFERKGVVIGSTPVQSIEPYPGLNDLMAAALLMASLAFSLWLLPLFALAVYQSVEIRRAGAPDRSGVGSAVIERFLPAAIAVPGGMKRSIVYSGRVAVTHTGVFVGGIVLGEEPRVPVVSLVGPSKITANMGQGTVLGHFRADVQDLRAPLTYSWSSDAEVLDSGPQTRVRFDPPPSGDARFDLVAVTVTDADGLVASETRRILVSTPNRQGGPGHSGGPPRQEP